MPPRPLSNLLQNVELLASYCQESIHFVVYKPKYGRQNYLFEIETDLRRIHGDNPIRSNWVSSGTLAVRLHLNTTSLKQFLIV